MSVEKVLFLGGPLDGQWRERPESPYEKVLVRVVGPLHNVDRLIGTDEIIDTTALYQEVRYRCDTVQCQGTRFYYFVVETMSPTEALACLLHGYRRWLDHEEEN